MANPEDSSRQEFWNVRYAKSKTPWDFGGVPADLTAFLKATAPARVLIPGCGRGYEVRAFAEKGWDVTAIDFSPVAAEQARAHLGEFGSRIILGDFFKYDLGEGCYDVVYERTFLCALPPRLWPAYAERVARLLAPGGKLAGIFLYGEEPHPPPYPITEERAGELLAGKFTLVRSAPVTDSLTLFAGKERWQEWEKI